MELSDKLKKIGYTYENNCWVKYKGNLIGSALDSRKVERLIKAHIQFKKEKDDIITHPSKAQYELKWNSESNYYMNWKENVYISFGFQTKDSVNKTIELHQQLLNNKFKINLTEEQIKEGYELSWYNENGCHLGHREKGFFSNGEYETLGIVFSNEEILKKINEFQNPQPEEELDFDI